MDAVEFIKAILENNSKAVSENLTALELLPNGYEIRSYEEYRNYMARLDFESSIQATEIMIASLNVYVRDEAPKAREIKELLAYYQTDLNSLVRSVVTSVISGTPVNPAPVSTTLSAVDESGVIKMPIVKSPLEQLEKVDLWILTFAIIGFLFSIIIAVRLLSNLTKKIF